MKEKLKFVTLVLILLLYGCTNALKKMFSLRQKKKCNRSSTLNNSHIFNLTSFQKLRWLWKNFGPPGRSSTIKVHLTQLITFELGSEVIGSLINFFPDPTISSRLAGDCRSIGKCLHKFVVSHACQLVYLNALMNYLSF